MWAEDLEGNYEAQEDVVSEPDGTLRLNGKKLTIGRLARQLVGKLAITGTVVKTVNELAGV